MKGLIQIFYVDRRHDRTGRDECNTESSVRCEDILTVWLPVQTWSLVRLMGRLKFLTINRKDDVTSDEIENTLTKGKDKESERISSPKSASE